MDRRTVIDDVIDQWHAYVRGELVDGLENLLDDEVVFYSPIVFTPQVGKAITTVYLEAALRTLAGEPSAAASDDSKTFGYTKDVRAGDTAMLEFETTLDGKYVNGIDIIRCNQEGRIIEFRVMIRPLQAINLLHRRMGEMLEGPT